ncbi:hypothetical protein GCM10028807_12470 [Spirosoma daeguense]
MKVFTYLLAGAGLLIAAQQVYSQDDKPKKPLNNPMYSSHNYKHPNMAAAAKTWETKKGVEVQKPGNSELANYKRQSLTTEPVGGIVLEHTPSRNVQDRNYKIQRLSEPKTLGPPSEYYVKQPERTTDTKNIEEVGNK